MRFPIFYPFWQILLAVLCVSLVACGSVANRAVSGAGGTPGSDDAGASDASATGGAGGTGLGDAGLGDAGLSDGPGIGVRGGISPFGVVSQPTGATIRITRQRFGPAPVCAGNVCVSGGLSPR